MQVLIFAGESYYPSKHLQDLVGTLSQLPSYDDIVRIAQAQMAEGVRFERLSGGRVDWVTALIFEEGQPPRRQAWTVLHMESSTLLQHAGCYRVWQDEALDWYGLCDAPDLEPLVLQAL